MNTPVALPASPEIAISCAIPGATINYHDLGQGQPLLPIHGSGPGVSAWANWRGVMPDLSKHFRVIAPDMLGFGHTRSNSPPRFDVERWVDALAQNEEQLRALKHPTLIMHGREDQVIPLSISLRLMAILPNATLLVFGNCGHWTQIEKREAFIAAVRDFMDR